MKLTKEQQRLLKECKWFLSTIDHVTLPKWFYQELYNDSIIRMNKQENEQPSEYQLSLLQGTNQE